MKNQFLLPVLAILFATGMSFTTAKMDADPNNDYVLQENGVRTISEVSCGQGNQPCEVTIDGEGPYPIFDDASMTSQKLGTGNVIHL